MEGAVIGLDTSCYTTSAALVAEDGRVLLNSRKLLPVAEGQRGLRQSEMVFLHTRQLPVVTAPLREALKGRRVKAVCASVRPRDDEDSYMPAFQVGDAHARGLAAVLGVPCFCTTHQRGHIRAAQVDSGLEDAQTFLAVHLSGGTTEILLKDGGALTLLGGTLDLSAGQLVDRTGVALGLAFPAGPALEEFARQGTARTLLPVSMEGASCHLSGAEAQIRRWLDRGGQSSADIAAEIYDLLARTLCRMLLAAETQTGVSQALIAGGVASSALLRTLVTSRMAKTRRGFRICFGKPEYSGDNAVGIALIGLEQYRRHTA